MDGYTAQVREQESIRFAGKRNRRQQRTGRRWQKELGNLGTAGKGVILLK